jgi:adenine deaminase
MDPECGFDGQRNVGVMGDRISIITSGKVKAKRTIEAHGHAMAPGFYHHSL